MDNVANKNSPTCLECKQAHTVFLLFLVHFLLPLLLTSCVWDHINTDINGYQITWPEIWLLLRFKVCQTMLKWFVLSPLKGGKGDVSLRRGHVQCTGKHFWKMVFLTLLCVLLLVCKSYKCNCLQEQWKQSCSDI